MFVLTPGAKRRYAHDWMFVLPGILLSLEAGQAAVLSTVIASGAIFGLIGPAIGGWTYASVPSLPPALPPHLVGAALCACTARVVSRK